MARFGRPSRPLPNTDDDCGQADLGTDANPRPGPSHFLGSGVPTKIPGGKQRGRRVRQREHVRNPPKLALWVIPRRLYRLDTYISFSYGNCMARGALRQPMTTTTDFYDDTL